MDDDKARLVKEMLKLIEEEETKFGESQTIDEYINPFNQLGSHSDGIHHARQHLLHAIRMTSMIAEKEVRENQIDFNLWRVDNQQRMILVKCTATLSVEERVLMDTPGRSKKANGQSLLKQIYGVVKAKLLRENNQ